ncbi:MAG: T9SS type A sorting domain-containing protein [candidate division Zixibacteria bacterium]|nr:T9SS type A sorting domain-containing protein [candidate division Zixibacteria bacterium]
MLFKQAFQIGVVVLVAISSSNASVSLKLEATYVVPGLAQDIRYVKFNDIDGDGLMELLISEGENVLLYSPALDSILFQYQVTEAYLGQILFADVNRDSVPDVVIGTYAEGTYSTWVITLNTFDGSSGFVAVSPLNVSVNKTMILMQHFITDLKAFDINRDGYNEVLFSFDSLWAGTAEQVVGSTRLYHSLPDSLIWRGKFEISDARLGQYAEDAVVIASRRTAYAIDHFVHEQSEDIFPIIFNSDGISGPSISYFEPQHCYGHYRTFLNSQGAYCAGNISGDESVLEVVSVHSWYQYCSESLGGDPIMDTSGANLIMHRVFSTDSSELAWAMPESGYHALAFDPSYHGKFIALSSEGKMVMFSIDDGTPVDSCDLPPGEMFWDYTYNDGIPALVIMNGNEVSIYSVGVSTGVDDETDDSHLPRNFLLHQPYPNPFNATQTIPITLNRRSTLSVEIFNLLGQKVTTLFEGTEGPGARQYSWEAGKYSSGVYLVRVQSGEETATRKVVLIK